jgi:GntR family transcriptional regulator
VTYPEDGPTTFRAIADVLRDRITSGAIRPGQRLPSERMLAQTYGVATKTGRAAQHELRDEGLVALRRGYGFVVLDPPQRREVAIDAGMRVVARPATAVERQERRWPARVWVLHVFGDDGVGDIYRADEVELRFT